MDNSIDEIRAYDIIEHLHDRIHTMNEIWRVCKPGARVDIFVPSTDGRGAFQDPTHISFWNINSFLYYCIEFPHYLELCRRYGFKGAFKVVKLENEETFSGVIHVKAELLVIKTHAELILNLEHNRSQSNTNSNINQHVNSQMNSPEVGNKFTYYFFDTKNNVFPIIKCISNEINRPLWSVMIPTYNGTKYLEKTLKSVLEQDLGSDFMQIEVVDDCSTQDDPEELVKEIGQGRVTFYRQPKNLGLIGNWNACINRAHGHWIHILHQDDVVKAGFYSRLQAALEKEPNIGAAFCRYFYMDEKGYEQNLSPLERETPGVISNWIERIAVVQRIQFASIVVKRKVYEELGGFCPEASSAADWEMWKRIAVHYPVWYEVEPLACYRLHPLSESSRLIRLGTNIADTRKSIEISRSYLPKYVAAELSSKALEHYALYAINTAKQMLNIGDQAAAIAQMQEALNCSQSSTIKDTLVSIFLSSVSDEPNFYLAQISNYVEQYQTHTNSENALMQLRDARNNIASELLTLQPEELENTYKNKLRKVHEMLLNSGIKDEPLLATEKDFVNDIVAYISIRSNDSKTISYLIAAMLYRRADQLSLQYDLTHIPSYLLNDYLEFILHSPACFKEIGEVDHYYSYMQGCLNYLHTQILSNPESKLWQDVALFFIQNANFIPLYFNSKNLKDIYTERADIMEFALKNQGHQIDYEFPERSTERKKIRLGILAAHFGSQTETFTTLPVYKYLNWNEFEIILYTIHTSNHRLERYCAGHADALITLPQDLASQVKTIRDGDLDILLVATNVTAVTNSVTLLALHRLARVQLTCFSSPVTTGMRNIDYYISGKLTEVLLNSQQHYREQLLTVDGPGYCFDYSIEPKTSIKPSRKSLNISDKSIVFISGANFYKIIPELRESWAKIIAAVSESVLVLYPFSPSWSSSYEAIPFINSMKDIFAKYGIEKERLIVLDALPSRSDVKEYLRLSDVYLDSYPYSGANSTVDPLEVGISTIVMDGKCLRSRQGAALLRELEITDLIADSEETYIQLAIALGTNPELRQQKSDQIKQRMQANPKFLDSRAYSAQMGALFQELFYKQQAIALTENLNLRESNLIIFPDWSQPEEALCLELAQIIKRLATYPDSSETTLLVDNGEISEEEANLILSSVAMNLLMEEDLDISEGLEISLVGHLSEIQWKALLPKIKARVILENENQTAIALFKAANIPSWEVNSLR